MKAIKFMLVVSFLLCESCFAIGRGGSNYNWYRVDNTYSSSGALVSCNREPYGVISNYHLQSSLINSQLQSMYAAGQRRLRMIIHHAHGLGGGTILDSTGGNLSTQHRANLVNFLAAIRNAGFSEILVSFGPVSAFNDPTQWGSWNQAGYDENWSFIQNVRGIVVALGLAYKIDLMNEGIPMDGTNNDRWVSYTQKLWAAYKQKYPGSDSVGFSFFDPYQVFNIRRVYGNDIPPTFDIHVYGGADSYNQIITFLQDVEVIPYGFIIGEAFYNDQYAYELKQAIDNSGYTVHYITQWPLTAEQFFQNNPSCPVTIAPPSGYNNYISAGF